MGGQNALPCLNKAIELGGLGLFSEVLQGQVVRAER